MRGAGQAFCRIFLNWNWSGVVWGERAEVKAVVTVSYPEGNPVNIFTW